MTAPALVQVSISQLAHAFSMARETVARRLADANVEPAGTRSGRPVFSLRDCVQALVHDDPQQLDPFRRKAALQSEQLQIRIATERGELVPIEDVRDTFAAALKPIRHTLETLPDLLERDAGLSAPQVRACERVIDKLRDALHLQLKELGDVR
jgi:hypothetical protein